MSLNRETNVEQVIATGGRCKRVNCSTNPTSNSPQFVSQMEPGRLHENLEGLEPLRHNPE